MVLDSFFDDIGIDIDSNLLLLLFLAALAGAENDKTEENGAMGKSETVEEIKKIEEIQIVEEKSEDRLEAGIPEPEPPKEAGWYIHKSNNRKRLKPKTVYF